MAETAAAFCSPRNPALHLERSSNASKTIFSRPHYAGKIQSPSRWKMNLRGCRALLECQSRDRCNGNPFVECWDDSMTRDDRNPSRWSCYCATRTRSCCLNWTTPSAEETRPKLLSPMRRILSWPVCKRIFFRKLRTRKCKFEPPLSKNI